MNNGAFQFNAARYSIAEASGQVQITVTRSASDGTATIAYRTADDTARAGLDYTGVSGTLMFAPGERQKTFTIPLINDNLHAPTRKLLVALSNPTGGATRGAQATAEVTVFDDDNLLKYNGHLLTIAAATELNGDAVTFDKLGDNLVVTVNGEQRFFTAALA